MGSFPTDSDKSQSNQNTSSCPPLSSQASCCQTWPQLWPLWQSASDKSIQEIRLNVLTLTPGYLTPWAPAGAWLGVARPAATLDREQSSCHTHTAAPGHSVPLRQQTSSRTSSPTASIWFSAEATLMWRSSRWPLPVSPPARPG